MTVIVMDVLMRTLVEQRPHTGVQCHLMYLLMCRTNVGYSSSPLKVDISADG